MRTITVNEKTFEEAVYPVEIEPSVFAKIRTIKGTARDSIRVTVSASYADVAAAFVNGAKWSITETVLNEDGTEAFTVYDKSEYSVAGDIVDHRDGRISVYMAKPTESESIRASVETILPTLDDATASKVVTLYGGLAENGSLVKAGTRINWGGILKRAKVDLWDTPENNPDNSPDLWDDILYKNGYRIIPDKITTSLQFAAGECGWWGDVLMRSKVDGNVYTPEEYADNWEIVNE